MKNLTNAIISPISMRTTSQKKTVFSAEQYKKVCEEFGRTFIIQGDIGYGDVEAITNDDDVVIGYKR